MPQRQGRDTPDHYNDLHRRFGWQVPVHFNMAQVCSRRWAAEAAHAQRTAVITTAPGQPDQTHSYGDLQAQANRLSHALAALGVQRGDRVAIVHAAALRDRGGLHGGAADGRGGHAAVSAVRPRGAGLSACTTAKPWWPCAMPARWPAVQSVSGDCPALRSVVAVGGGRGALDWSAVLAQEPTTFKPVNTLADEAAVLIYTSGTTGNPKGALIPHRALIGNLTGFVCSQNWFGFDPWDTAVHSEAVFWSPADWAWTGGLMDALLPTLYFGRPIVAHNGRFSPQMALELMQRHGVTHTFLFPTALKAMMKAFPTPRTQYTLKLQAIMSAGEAVGDAVFTYCRDQLGVIVNEMFGQTEINYIVGNCSRLWPARPGSMGKGYPGHRVAVIDDDGHECPVGVPGDVAVHRLDVHGDPDPIFFLGYWKNDASTRAKFTGDMASSWCRTGDMAIRDADGYLWYQGRSDDVFKAAGYRIGPSEIENCLVKHPAVANAAVVPKPDAERGAVVKAYVVLIPGEQGGEALIAALQQHVKGQLAPYEYPKEIEFIDALPMTTTGKVQRRVLRLQEEERWKSRQGG